MLPVGSLKDSQLYSLSEACLYCLFLRLSPSTSVLPLFLSPLPQESLCTSDRSPPSSTAIAPLQLPSRPFTCYFSRPPAIAPLRLQSLPPPASAPPPAIAPLPAGPYRGLRPGRRAGGPGVGGAWGPSTFDRSPPLAIALLHLRSLSSTCGRSPLFCDQRRALFCDQRRLW